MKWSVIAAVAVVGALGAHAADITLKDGRVFKSATIRSQTPTQVMIAYPGGLSSVPKKLLPPDLAVRYPIDLEAAAKIEAKLAAAKAARAELKQSPAPLDEPSDNTATAANAEPSGLTEEKVRSIATVLSRRYFQNDFYKTPHGRLTSEITLNEVRPIDGWTNRWLVKGTAVLRQYKAPPDGISSFGPAPSPFPSIENDQTRQYSGKELRRIRDFQELQTVETRAFEGTFSAEKAEPTIDITLI